MDTKEIFNDFAQSFAKKINKDYFIKIQLEILDMDNNIWQIDVKDSKVLIYNKQEIEPEEIFVLSNDTLIKLYNNEIAPLTAFLNEPNEKGEMCSLIELKNKTEDKKVYESKKPKEQYLAFLRRLDKFHEFFSKDYPTKIVVTKNKGVKAHSVNAIGLYCDDVHGDAKVLHAFFSIEKNESLKEPAIEFSIYVIKGNGMIVIDNEKYPIEKNSYYHLIPKNKLCIENNEIETLEILYLSTHKW
jgi:hypothetical protein